jgi:peptidoglycan/xylan/chitin deacetylase (PgdA/CDA1 family)
MSRLRAALTFDAEHPSRANCPPATTDRILDVLEALDARATFFVQGRWATAYPETARRIAAGHLVGNHSNHHAPMSLLSDAGIAEDIREAERRIRDVTGVDPRPWLRCPFGRGQDDARVVAAASSAGYRMAGWDVDGRDWDEERTGDSIAKDVIGGVSDHGDGAVVLLHSWPGPTPEALPHILEALRQRAFGFVTFDEVADGR